ncbi:MAG: zinc ribbon domain-containing protein [Deltaproteobacteria bacterium]|nr:zinc ribbon domain-containing protein [Deltaproteobacteria bacterium]
MPIYEYECESCHLVCEALQKFSDAPLGECPSCGGKVNRIMSLNAFHLKGQGWYVTDYKGKNSSTLASSSEGKSEGSDSASTSDACASSSKDSGSEGVSKPSAAKED